MPVARCLWDVFSDNHRVIAPEGAAVDIGSFRGAATFLADRLNQETGATEYDPLDCYMGTLGVRERADLTPVYAVIFRRLQALGYDWTYTFPRLHAVDLRGLDDDPPDPAAAVASQRELDELRGLLETGYQEAMESAKDEPPPQTVEAYRRGRACAQGSGRPPSG